MTGIGSPRAKRLAVAVTVSAAIAAVLVGGAKSPPVVSNAATSQELDLVRRVIRQVHDNYVDQPDDAVMMEGAINGMLTSLDPHSSYMTSQQLTDAEEEFVGEFGGIGLEVTIDNGLITVVSALDDTPASRAGIKANDTITSIDGDLVEDLPLEKAVDRLHGPSGSTVKLTVMRKGSDAPKAIELKREIIRINPVKWHAEGDVGYIRIATFTGQTAPSVEKAVEALKTQIGPALKGYVIDLRNDPGGLVDQAVSVADDFLDKGTILSIKGRHDSDDEQSLATPGDISEGKPLVVLINAGTASAAEIVTGAFQDDKRAQIVGTRSFGKGTVQTILPLGEGKGALRLTTARYYTPSGKSIQAKGIEPDFVVDEKVPDDPKLKEVANQSPNERSLANHLTNPGENDVGTDPHPSLSYVPEDEKQDTQLQYALMLLQKSGTGEQVSTTVTPPNPQVAKSRKLPPQ